MADIFSLLRGDSGMVSPLLRNSTAIPDTGVPMQQSGNLLERLVGGSPAGVAQAPAQQTSEPPRKRRSVLETIGRIADVIATVGGADALYQPSIDAREDRARAIDLEEMRKQQLQQQIAAGSEEAANLQRQKLGVALKGLQAIQARGGDANRAWPMLAQQAGITPDEAAQLGQVFQQDPNAIAAISAMFGETPDREFGLQPFYAQDAEGNLKAYQLGKDGSLQPVNLPDGVAPIDPLKFIDTGNQQVGVGTRSGQPIRVLPKGERPGFRGGQPINERPGFRGGRPIAPLPERAGTASSGKQGPSPAAIAEGAKPIVAGLKDAVNRLYKSGGMTDQNSGFFGTAGAIARENIPGVERFVSPEGFSAREDLTRLTTIGIPALLPLLGGLTIGGKNIDAAKELDTWRNAITSAKDYSSAMRAIAGFENRINELTRQASAAPAAAPKKQNAPAGGRKITPRSNGRGPSKPSVSNW